MGRAQFRLFRFVVWEPGPVIWAEANRESLAVFLTKPWNWGTFCRWNHRIGKERDLVLTMCQIKVIMSLLFSQPSVS